MLEFHERDGRAFFSTLQHTDGFVNIVRIINRLHDRVIHNVSFLIITLRISSWDSLKF